MRGSSRSQPLAGTRARSSGPAARSLQHRGGRARVLQDAADALFDLHLRLPSQEIPRAIDPGAFEPLVEAARLDVDSRPADQLGNAVHADLGACANVDRLTLTNPFRLARQDVGANNIADPGEVTRLQAVAVDGHRLVPRALVHEDADDQTVGTLGDLARTVDVEVAEA